MLGPDDRFFRVDVEPSQQLEPLLVKQAALRTLSMGRWVGFAVGVRSDCVPSYLVLSYIPRLVHNSPEGLVALSFPFW